MWGRLLACQLMCSLERLHIKPPPGEDAMDINSIGSNAGVTQVQKIANGHKANGVQDFSNALKDVVKEVNEAGLNANKAVAELAQGKTDSLHGVMLAMSKADLSFRFLMQTRNKLVGAYNEIMRMQV